MKIKVTVSYFLYYETDKTGDIEKFMKIYERELNRNITEEKLIDFKWEAVDESTT